MTDKPDENKVTRNEGINSTAKKAENGGQSVGPIATIVILIYLVAVAILLVYALIQFWPAVFEADEARSTLFEVTLFTIKFTFLNEVRLLFVVIIAGALGSMVHGFRSFYRYVGERQLKWSWVAMYILLPFTGATLALLFYLIVRGGFFSPQASVSDTSPAAFAALAALVGLSSEQAALALKKVADNLFEKPEKGTNPLPEPKPDA